jgi:hypothetical protein
VEAPIEVTVIDDSDIVGFAAAATRENEIYMTDKASMVDNILRKIRPYSRVCSYPEPSPIGITQLNILDHGNKDGIEIGNDWLDETTLPKYRATLGRLKGKFTSSGFVHLQLDFCSSLISLYPSFGGLNTVKYPQEPTCDGFRRSSDGPAG